MKAKYEKPRIAIESFTLSQSIAQSCGYNKDSYFGHPTHGDVFTCAWVEADGEKYWTQAATCGADNIVDSSFEGIAEGCYNAPSGSKQLFAS